MHDGFLDNQKQNFDHTWSDVHLFLQANWLLWCYGTDEFFNRAVLMFENVERSLRVPTLSREIVFFAFQQAKLNRIQLESNSNWIWIVFVAYDNTLGEINPILQKKIEKWHCFQASKCTWVKKQTHGHSRVKWVAQKSLNPIWIFHDSKTMQNRSNLHI